MDQHGAWSLEPQRRLARCNVAGCDAVGPPEDEQTAQARAIWHVYTKHPELWRMLHNGTSPEPDLPRPAR